MDVKPRQSNDKLPASPASPHSCCHFCGDEYSVDTWPRKCSSCNREAYLNPLPVAVALIPIEAPAPTDEMQEYVNLLAIKRTLSPVGLALPGGFIDYGESWQEACAREVLEETGLSFKADDFECHDVKSAPDGTVLIFGRLNHIIELADLDKCTESNETSGVAVLEYDKTDEVVFGLHKEIADEFLYSSKYALFNFLAGP